EPRPPRVVPALTSKPEALARRRLTLACASGFGGLSCAACRSSRRWVGVPGWGSPPAVSDRKCFQRQPEFAPTPQPHPAAEHVVVATADRPHQARIRPGHALDHRTPGRPQQPRQRLRSIVITPRPPHLEPHQLTKCSVADALSQFVRAISEALQVF